MKTMVVMMVMMRTTVIAIEKFKGGPKSKILRAHRLAMIEFHVGDTPGFLTDVVKQDI